MPTDLRSHSIVFTHPLINESLTVTTGANRISWAYNLVTQAYPTYAGEVVQVLSVNIDNLEITGDVRSYKEMEGIYRWFLQYLQKATQGAGGDNFIAQPVKMEYPHRGWTLYIKPISLPGMRYGREVVVPTWSMQAHIEDPDPEQRALTIDHAINGDVENWKSRVAADIGFRQANPFSDPLAVITEDEATLYPKYKELKGSGITVQKSGESLGASMMSVEDYGKAQGVALSGLAKQMNAMFQALSPAQRASGEGATAPTSSSATGGTGSSADKINGSIEGSPIPGQPPGPSTHETGGLPGYPARDYFAEPGTPVVAPTDGKITKLSGKDPAQGGVAGGAMGYSIYLTGNNGKIYFMTHTDKVLVKLNEEVKQGHQIAEVAKSGAGTWDNNSTHCHMGVHG